ncbi:MAG: protein translocase subunit SecY [Thermoanaerobaculum sp.]|uniref:Protein translocase subunit SecY n=1 Tax=Thermoanaerobaculum aquaticum TaxID=1312852 RepID=A0A7C2NFU5_9BACT|nr:MAG: protein translocase subunit SecY [Thermoanaerobaculum sp.]GBC78934.1 Protein translocase subunit SecY [bacterium HR09]
MIESLRNIFAIPDLRKRVMFTFLLLAVYRLGSYIPVPGINPEALEEFTRQAQGTILGFLNLFSGGALGRMTVFALGIMPYISASIILQLLTVVWPYLEKLSKEGELGRKKITQWTRYGTVILSIIQGSGIAVFLEKTTAPGGAPLVPHPGWGFRFLTVLTLVTGTAFVMWLGEQITERGVGNGISLIIFAGIVVGLPRAILNTLEDIRTGAMSIFTAVIFIVFAFAVVAAIVLMERAQRRIPVQYAKRVVGRRIMGGQSTYLPLRLNTGGVIPVIFAASILSFPQTLSQLIQHPWVAAVSRALAYGEPLYNLFYVASIIFFCYFYTSIIFNPEDTADNLRKYGGFIPGVRAGQPTADFIDRVLTRITFVGAIYLALVAILPEILIVGFKVAPIPVIGPFLDSLLPRWFTEGLGVKFYFGGTSLLIVVGVAMDTVAQIEAQLVMRHYEGFVKGRRLRGRRG